MLFSAWDALASDLPQLDLSGHLGLSSKGTSSKESSLITFSQEHLLSSPYKALSKTASYFISFMAFIPI